MLAVIGLTIYNLNPRAGPAAPVAGAGRASRPSEPVGDSRPRLPRKTAKPSPMKTRKSSSSFAATAKPSWTKRPSIRGFELPAYWRVMDWVQSQSLADLKGRSLPQFRFKNSSTIPTSTAADPFAWNFGFVSVASFEPEDGGKDSRPKTLYELWGLPTASDGWLYVVVTPELPPGFPMGKTSK